MTRFLLIVLFLFSNPDGGSKVLLPINSKDRSSMNELRLTDIGEFGLIRKARTTVPAHFHTGIDIKRPGNDYRHSPIYPVTGGVVVSIRNDGPYAQIIMEHEGDTALFWTVYEHISGIKVVPGQTVSPEEEIARFMNRQELDKYGWQFDHFHLEVLKTEPIKVSKSITLPQRRFKSYTLECITEEELNKHFVNPSLFLSNRLD